MVSAKDLFSRTAGGPNPKAPVKAETSLEGRQLMGTMIIGSERVALISGKPTPVRGQPAGQDAGGRGAPGEDYEALKYWKSPVKQ